MNSSPVVFGKKIQLFLLDGTPNGRWICELSNWTGKAYKIPRSYIKESEERDELTSPGVYFLFGKDENSNKSSIYIGEAENTISRLKQHISQRDDWNEVIVFISKDTNLNKAHIKYLEHRFYTIAKANNRYQVSNPTVPTKSSISEAEVAELEEFIHNAKILVNVLGHKAFETYTDKDSHSNKTTIFTVSAGGGKAQGMPTSEGFVLLKGSAIHEKAAGSLNINVKRKIDKSRESKMIIDNELQEDMLFSSSSAAAAFAAGYSISGPQQWKLENGKTLKEFETENNSAE